MPIIDLQSGSISLNNSATYLNKSLLLKAAPNVEPENNNTSLASRLLAIDKADSAKASVSPDNSDPKKFSSTLKVIAVEPANELVAINQYSTNPYYNELPFIGANTSDTKNVAQPIIEELAQNLPAKKNQTPSNTKSISELAFERTDSKRKVAKNNSYTKQISNLLNEPVTSSDALTNTLNRSHPKHYYQTAKSMQLDTNANHVNQPPLSGNDTSKQNLQHKTVAAKLVSSADPKYPSSAKRKGIELEVMVEFDIDRNGFVRNIEFESKSRVSYFRSTIRNAMEKWRFLPAKKNGRAVESKMSKIFSFSLLK